MAAQLDEALPLRCSTRAPLPAWSPERVVTWALPVSLALAWFLVTDGFHLFPPSQLPSPGRVIRTAVELARGGELLRHVAASTARVALGFSFAAVLGVGVGAWVGFSRTAERAVDPTLQALRSVPSLAWVPFLLLWLGIDEAPKIVLIAIGAYFPVYLNVVAGIRNTDRKLVEVGALHGLRGTALARRIVLPAALPSLLTGLRIGLGQGWLFLVAAELIASTRGLGFLLIDGQNSARADVMLVGTLALALLGKLSDGALRSVERHALRWVDGFGSPR